MRVRIRTFLPGRAQPSPPEAGEVHLWLAALDQPPEAREWLGGLLSAEERERAGRYRVARVRDQFVAGRGLLRLLLAGCLGADPREIPIVYEPNGKPVLGPGESLQFNLSHSEGRALIAIGRGGRVGVDLERVRPLANIDVLVERFFSPRERAAYRRLP